MVHSNTDTSSSSWTNSKPKFGVSTEAVLASCNLTETQDAGTGGERRPRQVAVVVTRRPHPKTNSASVYFSLNGTISH